MEIIRIVRLSFREDKVEDFMHIYKTSKDRIKSFEGCTHLELFRDQNHDNVFYTFSKWKSNDCLENYRISELFKTTWIKTKALFNSKPKAFSLKEFVENKK
jgi:quinol monooxygenase YgiN